MISFLTANLQELSIYPDAKCEEAPLMKCKRSDLEISFSPNINALTWGVFDYSLLDVIYCPRNIELSKVEHFQGRIKYPEWDMECETRIRVAMRPKGLEFSVEQGKILYLTPDNEYVFAKLPDSCLESMIITLSPYADAALKRKIEELLESHGLLSKVQVRKSVLTGEVG